MIRKLMKPPPLNICTLMFWLLINANPSFSLPTDRENPVKIRADRAKLDQKKGLNVYQGAVTIDQGSTHLSGDTVYVFYDKANQVTEVIALANSKHLAHYQTVPKPGQARFDAWALTIKFFPQAGMVLLIKQARARQGSRLVKGPLLTYNARTQLISSLTNETHSSAILIQPDKPAHA